MSRSVLATAVLAAALVPAACTSSGGPRPTGAPTTSGTPSTSTAVPGTTPAPTAAPGPHLPFRAAAGALLVVGPTADHADVYRVDGSGITRVTSGAAVTGVAADRSGAVVSVRPAGGDETVRALTGGATADLGIAAGFDPDLSSAGLVYATLDAGSSTPGVTKPHGFSVQLRTDLRGTSRTVWSTTASLGSPRWLGTRELLAAVDAGPTARVVRIDVATGAATTLTSVAGASDLRLVTGPTDLAVATDSGGVVVRLADRSTHPLPTGWSPLCWLGATALLATHSGRLATIGVDASGDAQQPTVLGRLPAGTDAFAASCGRVG